MTFFKTIIQDDEFNKSYINKIYVRGVNAKRKNGEKNKNVYRPYI